MEEKAKEGLRERLENDLAALSVLWGLARIGCKVARGLDAEDVAGLPQAIASAYLDGAGGMEPNAVVVWVQGEREAVSNSLDDVTGMGMPSPERDRREVAADHILDVATELDDCVPSHVPSLINKLRAVAEELRQ